LFIRVSSVFIRGSITILWMKTVWIGIVFLLAYGAFSMKTQAAQEVLPLHVVYFGS
jgi:hypothetical protein